MVTVLRNNGRGVWIKRVAHITFDMRIGGAERVILNLVENTDRSKYEVSVLCLNAPLGPFGIRLREKGFSVVELNRRPGFDISLIRQVRRYLRDERIDVVHCHQYTPYVYGVLGAAFTGCRVIFTEHGRFYPDRRKLKRVVLNPVLQILTDAVTAISLATREALIRYENFSGRKIDVIYNGLNDRSFHSIDETRVKRSLCIDENTFVFGTVARLDRIKNQPLMIRALNKVLKRHPETVLIVVGDGPERSALEALVKEMELSRNVYFTGFTDAPQCYYRAMGCFLLTSFSEGTAMTLLEAMACEIPCIVTDVGGNPEIVSHGETGFVIPNDDEKALVHMMCRIISEEKMRIHMGRNARKRFEKSFAVEKMVSAYQHLYDRERG